MAKENLTKIFLSASIPFPDRDQKYFATADIVSIRDAVRALATVVIPKAHLIWGGHPSITPLVRFVMDKVNANMKTHVTLYQSLYFQDKFPPDNFAFESIILTEKKSSREESLNLMRDKLIKENDFTVGIFIGGMEGVEEEFSLFKEAHPAALILPIASTGGAAGIIYEHHGQNFDRRLKTDYAYMALFRDLLNDYI